MKAQERSSFERTGPAAALLVLALLVLPLAPALTGCGSGNHADAAGDDPAAAQTASDEEAGSDGAEQKPAGKDDEKKEEAVPVEVVSLDRGRIESVLRFSTNLEAESEVQVISQAQRRVVKLLVEEGDTVKRGELLLGLQDEEQRLNLAKAKSQLEQAEREYERQQRLHEQELISEQEYNDATYKIDQLRLAVEDAERELSYAEVRAPISGTITSRLVNLGDHVQIGEHLFDMVDFDSIVARVFVPEKHLIDLRAGLPARITSQAVRGQEFDCAVKRISPIVDPRSGTVKVTIDVGRRAGLRPGMYVDVDLVVDANENALLVPKRALVYDNDQVFVYRLSGESRVERVFIEPRLTDKFNVEPLDGLTTGDQIVVAGQAGLKDGALVKLPGEEAGASNDGGSRDETLAASQQRASL